MSSIHWNVSKWNGSSWTSDGTLPNPENEITTPVSNNAQVFRLYDGSEAIEFPNYPTLREQFEIHYSEYSVTSALIDKIEGYIRGHIGLSMTSHTGQLFLGYFTNGKKVYAQSGAENRYRYEVSFKPFAVDGITSLLL